LLAPAVAAYKRAEGVMKQPPKKQRTVILIGLGILALSVPGLAVALFPKHSPPYSSDWPVSESDYFTAVRLVSAELGSFQNIIHVTVSGPDDITLVTSCPFLESPDYFRLKRTSGEWRIESRHKKPKVSDYWQHGEAHS
jgi:hypothetical protein